jgi:hypothetical protein
MDQETKQMFGVVIDTLNIMNDRLNTMDSRQNEIFSVVKAIEHANSVNRAEIDSLTYKVGNVEGTFQAVSETIEKRIATG